MTIGTKFRLIGQTTEFVVVKVYLAAGFIPAIVGYTLDGSHRTNARIADVIAL